MKVWITKYALTSGIFEAEAEVCSHISEEMIKLTRPGRCPEMFHGEGKEWHRTKESALERLTVMKENKISSLKRKIKKIESIIV